MMKKVLAAVVLAILAIFSVPTFASAAQYVPTCSASVTGSQTPGGTVIASFCNGSFIPGENVSWAVSGNTGVTLGVFRAATVTLVKQASSGGASSVSVTFPSNATGAYSITATGLASGTVGSATVPLATPSSGAGSSSGLPPTGYAFPTVLLWAAGGALLLGITVVVMLTMARRRHADQQQ